MKKDSSRNESPILDNKKQESLLNESKIKINRNEGLSKRKKTIKDEEAVKYERFKTDKKDKKNISKAYLKVINLLSRCLESIQIEEKIDTNSKKDIANNMNLMFSKQNQNRTTILKKISTKTSKTNKSIHTNKTSKTNKTIKSCFNKEEPQSLCVKSSLVENCYSSSDNTEYIKESDKEIIDEINEIIKKKKIKNTFKKSFTTTGEKQKKAFSQINKILSRKTKKKKMNKENTRYEFKRKFSACSTGKFRKEFPSSKEIKSSKSSFFIPKTKEYLSELKNNQDDPDNFWKSRGLSTKIRKKSTDNGFRPSKYIEESHCKSPKSDSPSEFFFKKKQPSYHKKEKKITSPRTPTQKNDNLNFGFLKNVGLYNIIEKNFLYTGENNTKKNKSKNNFGFFKCNSQSEISDVDKMMNIINLGQIQKKLKDSIIGIDSKKPHLSGFDNSELTDVYTKLQKKKYIKDEEIISQGELSVSENIKVSQSSKSNYGLLQNQENMDTNLINNICEKYRFIRKRCLLYDSLDDEEIEEEEVNLFYFHPTSITTHILDFFVFSSSLLCLFCLPLYIGKTLHFHHYYFYDFILIANDIINIIDLISGFFRAFYNYDEYLVKNSKDIILNFLNGWFFLDLIAGIPSYLIIKLIDKNYILNNREYLTNKNGSNLIYSHNYDINMNNFHYLLLINKLLKEIKINQSNNITKIIGKTLSEIEFIEKWGNVLLYSFFAIAFINLGSCLFIFIGRNSNPNWIINLNMQNESFITIYLTSFYYLTATLTTVGYGDVPAISLKERIFQIILLISGTITYSWIVSSISSYIHKMNDKTANYENKVKILNEIKLSFPNISNKLYDKILRHLHYRHFHEQKDKKIIIGCLPVSLRNSLIIEMYKPIIENFIFFKNFDNSDFIVHVVMAFRPVLAVKGDILVQEGDYIDDIIFVKSGILGLCVTFNLDNPTELLETYLNQSGLGKSPKKNKNKSQSNDSSLNGFEKEKNIPSIKENIEKKSQQIKNNQYNNVIKTVEQIKIEQKKNFQYVKVIEIRKNEHFGDILMFLNERSPLTVKVKTKSAELFFLRKMDAIEISSNFQNIWRRINKKSLHNMKQIKKLIRRAVNIFCSLHGYKINPNKRNFVESDEEKAPYRVSELNEITEEEDDENTSKWFFNDKNKHTNILNKISNDKEHIENNYENAEKEDNEEDKKEKKDEKEKTSFNKNQKKEKEENYKDDKNDNGINEKHENHQNHQNNFLNIKFENREDLGNIERLMSYNRTLKDTSYDVIYEIPSEENSNKINDSKVSKYSINSKNTTKDAKETKLSKFNKKESGLKYKIPKNFYQSNKMISKSIKSLSRKKFFQNDEQYNVKSIYSRKPSFNFHCQKIKKIKTEKYISRLCDKSRFATKTFKNFHIKKQINEKDYDDNNKENVYYSKSEKEEKSNSKENCENANNIRVFGFRSDSSSSDNQQKSNKNFSSRKTVKLQKNNTLVNFSEINSKQSNNENDIFSDDNNSNHITPYKTNEVNDEIYSEESFEISSYKNNIQKYKASGKNLCSLRQYQSEKLKNPFLQKIICESKVNEEKKVPSIKKFNNISLSETTISFELLSIYDNINEITNFLYCQDLRLQQIARDFLINECDKYCQQMKQSNIILHNSKSFAEKKLTKRFTSVNSSLIGPKKSGYCTDESDTFISKIPFGQLKTLYLSKRAKSRKISLKKNNSSITNDDELNKKMSVIMNPENKFKKRNSLFTRSVINLNDSASNYNNNIKTDRYNSFSKKCKSFKYDTKNSFNKNFENKKSILNVNRAIERNQTFYEKIKSTINHDYINVSKVNNNNNSNILSSQDNATPFSKTKKKQGFLEVIDQNIISGSKNLNSPSEYFSDFFKGIIQKKQLLKEVDVKSHREDSSVKDSNKNINTRNHHNNRANKMTSNHRSYFFRK